ncbi:MAG: hydrogenase iron-sulfur subunit [Candidatus Hodarchaeales archaeon]|jgi:heterodisulfide reductase subunit A
MKIATVLCNCGNSLNNIDWRELRRFVEEKDKEGYCIIHDNACSKENQVVLTEFFRENKTDTIVFGGCTPKTAGYLFEKELKEGGYPPWAIVGANLREHVGWVTTDKEKATAKAKALVHGALEKAKHRTHVEQHKIPISKNVVVVGAGPAGMQVTQDLATAGFKVYLIERNSYIGGFTSKTGFYYPTDDCSACMTTEGIKGVHQPNIRRCHYRSAFELHPKINLLMRSVVEDVSGSPGNYRIKIRKKPTYVRMNRCVLCNECVKVCPVEKPDEFNIGMTTRKAIHLPDITASSSKYVINRDECPEGCWECEKACKVHAIKLDEEETTFNITTGAIVAATGFQEYNPRLVEEYHYEREGFENVLTQTELARLLDITGPTNGLLTKKNGDSVKSLVMINCVGSRSTKYNEWCSNICCMIGLKHAIKLKGAQPDIDVTICYIDIRAVGSSDYERYYARARELGVKFIKGRPSDVDSDGKNLFVNVEDAGTGEHRSIRADMVTLSMAMVPSDGVGELAEKLNISTAETGFFETLYSKFRPSETKQAGVFVAGACIAPADIPNAVTYASASAAKVSTFLRRDIMVKRFPIAEVDEEKCTQCGVCIAACPYGAMQAMVTNPSIKPQVNEATCMGCGQCVSTCPVSAINIPYYTEDQIISMIAGTLYDAKETSEPLILALACWECAYASVDFVGQLAVTRPEMRYPHNVRIVPVQCVGHISTRIIQKSFELGADGVLVIGCYEDRCHYDTGSKASIIRVELFRQMLEQLGIDPRRLEKEYLYTVNAEKFVKTTERMTETLRKIGKLKRY